MVLSSDEYNSDNALLQEAEDYLKVKPSKSIQLLNQIQDLAKQSSKFTIRWHIIKIKAAVSTNHLTEIQQSLAQIYILKKHPYFIKNLPTILSAAGIYLRRSGFYAEAELATICALQYSTSDKQRLSLINSLALISRQLGQHTEAERLYVKATALAKKLNSKQMLATIANNRGAMALDLNKLEQAERYFRHALAGYQAVSKRSGNITVGLNLLFVFLLQNDLLNYQRLYSPINKLTKAFPNKSKHALLLWIHWTYKVMIGEALTENTKNSLIIAFNEIESVKLKSLVKRHLAVRLSINVVLPEKVRLKSLNQSWIGLLNCQ